MKPIRFGFFKRQESSKLCVLIYLQETYSSAETIKRWETEWGGKIISSHGSSHSRGVMILFKPRLDVGFEKITTDSYGRFIIAEAIIDGTKIVLVNIYAPNDAKQQVVFLRDLSKQFLSMYAKENLLINCVISTLDKKDGRSIDSKQTSIDELQALIISDCCRCNQRKTCLRFLELFSPLTLSDNILYIDLLIKRNYGISINDRSFTVAIKCAVRLIII